MRKNSFFEFGFNKKSRRLKYFTFLAAVTLMTSPVFSQNCNTAIYDWNSSWVFNGSGMSINTVAQVGQFNNTACGVANYMYFSPTQVTPSGPTWTCDFEFTVNGGNNAAHSIISWTESSLNAHGDRINNTLYYSDQSVIEVALESPDPVVNGYMGVNTGNWFIRGRAKARINSSPQLLASSSFTPAWYNSNQIFLPANTSLNTTFYGRLQRISVNQCMISIFSDAARTQHITGSPQCWTMSSQVANLTTLQHGSLPEGYPGRTLSATFDNVYLCNMPVAINGPTSVCISQKKYSTFTLVNNNSNITNFPGATSYTWALPTESLYSGSLTGTNLMSIQADINTSGYVLCTVNYPCASVTYSLYVNAVAPTVDAGPDQFIGCIFPAQSVQIGGNPTASGSSIPIYTYSWNPNTYLSSATASNPYSLPPTGSSVTYTVTVVDGQGCSAIDVVTVSNQVTPTVNAGPDKVIDCYAQSPVTIGGSPTASGPSSSYSYSWSPSSYLSSSTVANPTSLPPPTYSVTYTVTVSDAYGCSASDIITVSNPMCLRNLDNNTKTISVHKTAYLYPNPTNGMITVKSEINEPFSVTIKDSMNKTCFKGSTQNNLMEIDLSDQNKGFYFIIIDYSNKQEFQKLIIN